MLDGARNAMMGFLYQLLGTASVRVREITPGNDAWASLIARIGDGTIVCEEFGQDAIARPPLTNHGVIAIQFKHSADPNKPIETNEFIEILFAFDQSRRDAAAAGETIEEFILITNRSLGEKAQKLLYEAKMAQSVPNLLRLRKQTRAGKTIVDSERRLAPYAGDVTAAAQAWFSVLRSLTVHPGANFDGDLNRLRMFAARYGVLGTEWDGRLNALVGAFVRETAANNAVEVTREWLKAHLVGDPNAASLQFGSAFSPHVSTGCKCLLDDHRLRHRVPEGYYLRRETHQAVRNKLAENTVVFVYGDGGCGKSLAVLTFLQSICDRQFVWSVLGADVTELAIVDGINRLRLPGSAGSWTDRVFGDVRKRLEVANPIIRPGWIIDLDGVDEAPDRQTELVHLIRTCWAGGSLDRSPASLIVTCRTPAYGGQSAKQQLINDWLGSPEWDLVPGVDVVSVGDFLDQDLVEAAALIGQAPEERIIAAVKSNGAGGPSRRFQETKAISMGLVESLRHPVVWGGYASLPQNEREGVLDGNPVFLDRLADQLLSRFLVRCRSRKHWTDDLNLKRALGASTRSLTGQPPHTVSTWQRQCAPFLSSGEALALYHECLTYGIVRREAGTGWRWGHRFVVDYLAKQPNGGVT
jgi:hypothetical protein